MDLQIDREAQSPKGGGIQGEMREKKHEGLGKRSRGGEGIVVREEGKHRLSKSPLKREISQQGYPQSGSEFPFAGRMRDVFWGDSNHQHWAGPPKTLHT